MTWNWQLDNWPCFTWDEDVIRQQEELFLHQSGILLGAFRHLRAEDRDLLNIELISTEALKSSEIEGEFLNRDSVQSSLLRQFGLQSDDRRIPAAEQGMSEMMVNLYRGFAEPISHQTLHKWHRHLKSGREDLYEMGSYRRHKNPMQVISGSIHEPTIHFEAPPSEQVQGEMDSFVQWFNDSEKHLPGLTRAGIAHLYFVSIHPYEDGNGRIGRAVAEKALAQGVGSPALTSLSAEIERRKKEYYDSLARANRQLDLTDWLCWFADVVLKAATSTEGWIQFLIDKTRLYDQLRGKLNPRQEKGLERMFREGPSGFTGGLSAKNYLAITKTSRATATRDLAELVELGALRKTGKGKGTRYHLALTAS